MKNAIIALLACGTLGTLAIPAHADDVVIQDGYQSSAINGWGNTNVQQGIQNAYPDSYGLGYPENNGYVQRQGQDSTINGIGNINTQSAIQDAGSTTYYPGYPSYPVDSYFLLN